MALLNQIGQFTFLDMRGPIGVTYFRIEVLERSGVNGVALWNGGFGGQPFRLQTRVDFLTQVEALQVFDTYVNTQFADAQSVVWHGTPIVTYLYSVLDVKMVSIMPALSMIGGLSIPNGGNGVMLTADWELIAIQP